MKDKYAYDYILKGIVPAAAHDCTNPYVER